MSVVIQRKPITPFTSRCAGFIRIVGGQHQREISGGHWTNVSPVMYSILKTKGYVEVKEGRIVVK